MNIWKFILILSFLVCANTASAQLHTVERVKTADRINVSGDKAIRLIGVEAPEMRNNGRAKRQAKEYGMTVEQVNQLGEVGYVFVRSLIQGKEVWLEFDERLTDNSGQFYAYLFYEATDEEVEFYTTEGLIKKIGDKYYVFLNALLIELDYARFDADKYNLKYQYFLNRISKKTSEKDNVLRYLNEPYLLDDENENRLFYKF